MWNPLAYSGQRKGADCYLVIGGRRDGGGAMRRVGRCVVEVSRKGCPCHWLIRCQSLSSTDCDRQDQPGGADNVPLRVQKTLCPRPMSSGKVIRASANLRLATEGYGLVFRNLLEATDGQLQGPTGDEERLWKVLD